VGIVRTHAWGTAAREAFQAIAKPDRHGSVGPRPWTRFDMSQENQLQMHHISFDIQNSNI
jgi:hypothetical protein